MGKTTTILIDIINIVKYYADENNNDDNNGNSNDNNNSNMGIVNSARKLHFTRYYVNRLK